MNTAKKAYSSKAAAKRAMKRKANYINEQETAGSINFGLIWFEGCNVYASSNYWSESTLEDFLNSKSKLTN